MRATGRGDIRHQGSGNIGASNVWRVHGAKLGVPVVLVDVAKGLVPALLGSALAGPLAGVLAGAAAALGHWRPVFMGLQRGGKMVATGGGAFFGVAPVVALCAGLLWLVAFLVTRYASVASIVAAVTAAPIALLLGSPWEVVAFAATIGAAVIVLHRGNIARLRAGTESKFAFGRN